MLFSILFLAGAGFLFLPGAFALWLAASAATLLRRPRLWPFLLAGPGLLYLAVIAFASLLALVD